MRYAILAMAFVATAASAECDKLSVVDSKALTKDQLERRICRDMTQRNAYVDSANSFLTHTDMVQTLSGGMKVTPHAGFYAFMARTVEVGGYL